jgi:hypothetical protein
LPLLYEIRNIWRIPPHPLIKYRMRMVFGARQRDARYTSFWLVTSSHDGKGD